jgi:hypothetical protein
VLAGHAAAATLPKPTLALSPAQQVVLQRLACGPYSDDSGITVAASRAAGKAGGTSATVRCPLVRRVQDFPTFYQRNCLRIAARPWRCNAPLPGFHLPLGSQQVPVTYRQDNTPLEIAAQVADLIGRQYGFTFNGRNLSLIVRGECHVSGNGPGIAPGMVNYLLRCGDDGVIVTRACHQQTCRLFPSALFDPKRAVASLQPSGE